MAACLAVLVRQAVWMMGYEALAAEYYDADRHPTCADFREATRILLESFIDAQPALHPSLEVGAGCSLVAEVFAARGIDIAALTLTDASTGMLAHSAIWAARGARVITAAVDAPELPTGPYACIFACLGDPYNGPALWQAVARRLRTGGVCFYATPSFEWAEAFRHAAQQGETSVAEFLVGGRTLSVPSIILPQPAQREMIEAAGLKVIRVDVLPRRALNIVRSPKLGQPRMTEDMPVVTSYVAVR